MVDPKSKKAAKKSKPKAKPKAPARQAPEVYICTVGWVKYHGRRYEKGETILIQVDRMSDGDMVILEKYFELKPTEIMAGVSEPAELLEGESHGSNSS